MKKFLSLLLVGLMLLSLCGCFGDQDVRGEVEGGNDPEFSLGTAKSGTYKNDFLGISCTLPSGWTFYSDKEIRELNNLTMDMLDEDIAERLEKANIIYDMFATCQTTGSNMNVVLEKLSTAQTIKLDIKATLEAQFDTLKSSYESMGYTNISVKYQKVKVDGKEFDGLRLTAKIQGIDFYTTMFAFKKSNYLANVTICSLQTDQTGTVLGYFTVE